MKLPVIIDAQLDGIRLDGYRGDDVRQLDSLGDGVDHPCKKLGTAALEDGVAGGEVAHGRVAVGGEDTPVGVGRAVEASRERVGR